MKTVFVLSALLLLCFASAGAQMTIPSDKDSLLNGAGMGQAMYAEENGYPSPSRVLGLKDDLGLTKDQLYKTDQLMNNVMVSAKVKGQEIVEAEEDLNKLFAAGTLSEKSLRSRLERIGRLRGELRFIHLQAHLKMKQILSPNQVERYNQLRGHETK
jgi:Spy/CpxP family protein refolding chaperone